jgi:hypothetical protein
VAHKAESIAVDGALFAVSQPADGLRNMPGGDNGNARLPNLFEH